MSYLKLCLSGKHSEFKQIFLTPTAEFQQSQCHKLNLFFQATFLYCESYLFLAGEGGRGRAEGLLPLTAILCWPCPPLPTFLYCCHSFYWLILVVGAVQACQASQHLYELMLLGPISHFGTSICWAVLQLLLSLSCNPDPRVAVWHCAMSKYLLKCMSTGPQLGATGLSCHGTQYTWQCPYFMALCTPVSHMNTINKMHLSIT